MKYTSIHYIYVPFTGVGIASTRKTKTEHMTWLKARIEVFKTYTLESLKNQTNKNFILWLGFRPEEKNNPLLEELFTHIQSLNMTFLATYEGMIWRDDKYELSMKDRFENLLRIGKGFLNNPTLEHITEMPRMIRDMVIINRNNTLFKRLTRFMNTMRPTFTSGNFSRLEWVYLTRIDSDDMLHKDAVAEIQKNPPQERKALVFKKGYIYNANTQELAYWHPDTNPPFFTIIFPAHVFFQPSRYMDYWGGFKSHEDIPKVFEVTEMPDYMYSVTIHKKHISTIWDHPFKKETITDHDKKQQFVKDFITG